MCSAHPSIPSRDFEIIEIILLSGGDMTESISQSRVYTDVNVHRPAEYWDYENLMINWG